MHRVIFVLLSIMTSVAVLGGNLTQPSGFVQQYESIKPLSSPNGHIAQPSVALTNASNNSTHSTPTKGLHNYSASTPSISKPASTQATTSP